MKLVLLLLAVAAVQSQSKPSDPAALLISEWNAAVDPVLAQPLPVNATLGQRVTRLAMRDEITRQHAWRASDPRLSPAEQVRVGIAIGTRMSEIDRANTEALKAMLPADGWFRNSRDGRQVTHGAWLIAQHSPDRAFRASVLEAMRSRLASGDVDAMDFALTTDRVQVNHGAPQTYGSQAQCRGGRLTIMPTIEPGEVDARRASIGWSKSLAETAGDLEIGKPCAL